MSVGKLFLAFLAVAFVVDLLLQHHGLIVIADDADNERETSTTTVNVSYRPPAFCNCQQRDVDANTGELLTLMNKIVGSPFFRFYKANTHKECPYWAVQLLCSAGGGGGENPCGLCSCNEDDIPLSIRATDTKERAHDDEEGVAAGGDVLRSSTTPTSVHLWGQENMFEDSFGNGKKQQGKASEDDVEEAQYVDLVLNPEGNTGYTGPMAIRVWEAIYAENCLKDVAHPEGEAVEMCSEFLVFYRLMSGFHSSIGINVATNFHKQQQKSSPSTADDNGAIAVVEPSVYTPNCGMLNRMRSFAERRENLNFLYQFVLRAVSKVAPLLMHEAKSGLYNSGDRVRDKELIQHLEKLFASPLLCSSTFDDAKFLQSKYAHHLIPQMLAKMKNVSLLMDCVSCEKCRLWGKLEATGIAAAIKIIVSTESVKAAGEPAGDAACSAGHDSLVLDPLHHAQPLSTSDGNQPTKSSLRLLRKEKVALLNLMRQLTLAVDSVAHNCLE